LRNYFFEEGESDIKYSSSKKGYYLEKNDKIAFTNEELLAVSKIILESRAFNKEETEKLIMKLVNNSSINDREIIKNLINSEKVNYIPLQHGQKRIDRMKKIENTGKKFKILNYSDKFKDGEFRKYIHFMHSGPLTKIKFEYKGYIEYVLDKFPTARILKEEKREEKNGEYTIYTVFIEVYGSFGAEMWLRSQGDYVIEYKILK